MHEDLAEHANIGLTKSFRYIRYVTYLPAGTSFLTLEEEWTVQWKTDWSPHAPVEGSSEPSAKKVAFQSELATSVQLYSYNEIPDQTPEKKIDRFPKDTAKNIQLPRQSQ
jgi:hypothetical protein